MRAVPLGTLRVRLTVLVPVDVDDGAGGLNRTYSGAGDVWGTLAPLSAQERFVAQKAEQSINHQITIRWRSDVHVGSRLQAGARLFLVHGCFDPTSTGRYLVCRCEEISS